MMTSETVWSDQGHGDKTVSVDLEFDKGVYRFNLIQPPAGGDWGSVSLESIISVPDLAFEDDTVYFPTQMRIERACRVYATLDVSMYENALRWEVSITRLG